MANPCKATRNASEELVREFYANATGCRLRASANTTVFVRGIEVPFHSASINRVYGVPEVRECGLAEVTRQCGSFKDHVGLNSRLGVTSNDWFGVRSMSVSEAALNTRSKGIHKFICGRFIPSGHSSDVIRSRAVLNYAIQDRIPINWGAMVEEAVFRVVQGLSRTGGLVFPHLITDLCVAHGVPVVDTERLFPPKALVTLKRPMERTQAVPIEEADLPEGADDEDADEDDDTYMPDQGGYDYTARFDSVEQRLGEYDARFGRIDQELGRIGDGMGTMHMDVTMLQQDYQRTHYDTGHLRQQNDAMHEMMSRFATHFDINMDGIPQWPTYQPPPPPF